jgi:hypothetical protein
MTEKLENLYDLMDIADEEMKTVPEDSMAHTLLKNKIDSIMREIEEIEKSVVYIEIPTLKREVPKERKRTSIWISNGLDPDSFF